MLKQVLIHTEYITLGQLLKYENIIESGGFVKDFLALNRVKVNGEAEARRGRKLYPDDLIEIKGYGTCQIINEA